MPCKGREPSSPQSPIFSQLKKLVAAKDPGKPKIRVQDERRLLALLFHGIEAALPRELMSGVGEEGGARLREALSNKIREWSTSEELAILAPEDLDSKILCESLEQELQFTFFCENFSEPCSEPTLN